MPKSLSEQLTFLGSQMIAMEADDITTQTANEVRSVLGGKPIAPPSDAANNDRDEENLEKVDDIFGIKENSTDKTPQGDPNKTPEEVSDVDTSDNDNPVDRDENKSDDTPNETPDMPEEPIDPDLDLSFSEKNRIRDNMIQLYNIVSGDIEILVNSLNNTNTIDNVQIINSVLNHMRNIKDTLYNIIITKISSTSYDELLQKYITLKRVYDICSEMLSTHFNEKSKNKNTTK